MERKIYTLNEKGQALLKNFVDPLSDFYIDAVLDLEDAMEREDMPQFNGTIFGAEHFDLVTGEWA